MKYGFPISGFLMLTAAFVLSGCQSCENKTSKSSFSIIYIGGSSTIYPLSEALAEEYKIAHSDASPVMISMNGTGAGFKKFCRGELSVQNASREISPEEKVQCESNQVDYLQLPIAKDGIALIVHPSNHWVDGLTVQELALIWGNSSKVSLWSDVRSDWPRSSLKLFGPSPDNGTTDFFSMAIMQKSNFLRADYFASNDYNVIVNGVAGEEDSLGFVGYAYADLNRSRVKIVGLKEKKDIILPSVDSIHGERYRPLGRTLYVYISLKQARENPGLISFIDFMVKESGNIAPKLDFIPLSDKEARDAQATWQKEKLSLQAPSTR